MSVCQWIWGIEHGGIFISDYSDSDCMISIEDGDTISEWVFVNKLYGPHAIKRLDTAFYKEKEAKPWCRSIMRI